VTPTFSQAKDHPKTKPRLFAWLSWTLLIGCLGYFIHRNVPQYFVFTPKSYGDHFWPRASLLFPHVASGLLAILIGPLQFWSGMRRRYMRAHRIAGRVYVLAVLAGSIAALGLAVTIDNGSAYSLGFAGLAVAWLTTTTMAFIAIRQRNIEQHKQWMIRSYVVTFAFVTFRLLDQVLGSWHVMTDGERASTLAWSCWAIPLLVTEVVIQSRSLLKAGA
jgi:uncharacterized membrane protein